MHSPHAVRGRLVKRVLLRLKNGPQPQAQLAEELRLIKNNYDKTRILIVAIIVIILTRILTIVARKRMLITIKMVVGELPLRLSFVGGAGRLLRTKRRVWAAKLFPSTSVLGLCFAIEAYYGSLPRGAPTDNNHAAALKQFDPSSLHLSLTGTWRFMG